MSTAATKRGSGEHSTHDAKLFPALMKALGFGFVATFAPLPDPRGAEGIGCLLQLADDIGKIYFPGTRKRIDY